MDQPRPMHEPARVRLASLADVDAIARVHVRSWQVAYRGQLPDELLDNLSAERRVEAWRRTLESSGPVLVADRDGVVVGFASVGPSRDEDAHPADGELHAIYVDPPEWDSGVGRALMDRAVAELRRLGYRQAILWVLEPNRRARRFYEIAGWAADGGRKIEEQAGVEFREVRYRRAL
jgi:L-amino acid N-acyltransferase YncA